MGCLITPTLSTCIKYVLCKIVIYKYHPSGKIKVQPPRPQPTTPAITRVTIPYIGKALHKLQRILKTVNIEVRHRSSNKLHSSLHTQEHKAFQRLGDGDKSAIVKHAQQQPHKINW